MFRIRFHGRGGQGMKTASRNLGTAFFMAGYEVQDAPRYGAERRGAPIFAYVRADRSQINERGMVTSALRRIYFLSGRLAVQTGIWPLKEYIDGKLQHTKAPKQRKPVEEYLKFQGLFKHLFHPRVDDRAIAEIQMRVDTYWKNIV